MIIKEFYITRKDRVHLYKTYSTKNVYIQKVGTDEIYSIAYDVIENNFDYIETEKGLEKI